MNEKKEEISGHSLSDVWQDEEESEVIHDREQELDVLDKHPGSVRTYFVFSIDGKQIKFMTKPLPFIPEGMEVDFSFEIPSPRRPSTRRKFEGVHVAQRVVNSFGIGADGFTQTVYWVFKKTRPI